MVCTIIFSTSRKGGWLQLRCIAAYNQGTVIAPDLDGFWDYCRSCLINEVLIYNLGKFLDQLASANMGGTEDSRCPPQDLKDGLSDETTRRSAF